MHLDEFIARSEPTWERLQQLTARARRGRADPAELAELLRCYQRVSTHLSMARSRFRDPELEAALTVIVADAHAAIYGARPRTLRAAGRFVTTTFPGALWHERWFVLIAALVFCLPAVAVGVWMATSPAALEAAAPEALREAYVAEDFEAYYTALASAEFAAAVTTNNIQVGLLAFGGGVLLCLPTVAVLAINGANVGFAAGLFHAAGQAGRFWGLILPHGLLELTAVFVAGGVGLRLGWTVIDPGDRLRRDALVEEGRRAVAVAIGLVGVFAVAGLIEGFVTGAPVPTWLRVSVGVAAEAAFLTYAGVLGSAAAARGQRGTLEDADEAPPAPYSRPVAFARR